ncbi:MAG: cbb3-type cytochrome oxidase assembly protein CcoS [Gammaproteobacteria bacterium]|nr:cbb3-type cytochrome oxidase assembly protein CcoS [Gammaproteobacteria bacterium]
MDVIYGLIPSMIIIGIILVIILFWAIKSGQFDDLEGDAHRILMDEDLTPLKRTSQAQSEEKADESKDKPDENLKKSFSDKADKKQERG